VSIRRAAFRAAFRTPSWVVSVFLAGVLVAGCAGRAHVIGADLTPTDLDGLVDSTAARGLLADLLARRSLDPTLTARVPDDRVPDAVRTPDVSAPPLLPEQQALRELAEEVSLDFAALFFARALGADGTSRVVQAAFNRALTDGPARSEQALRAADSFPYTVLFAPSWMYRSHPETGADFAVQRQLLDRLGISNVLIVTRESASVEDNAAAIAEAVRGLGADGNGVILVSASKSGAEVALALSRVLSPDESARVVAWVNIVGALAGSPLADSALRPPVSWIARTVFWLRGWDFAGLISMATAPSRARLRGGRVPDSIAVVNVVAVPLSRTVGFKVWSGYRLLRRHGPNDGVVLLADTVWPGGINLVSIGPDHLFAPREDDAYSLALLRAIDAAVRLQRTAPSRAATPVEVGSRAVPLPSSAR
jgi:hypothetical protein